MVTGLLQVLPPSLDLDIRKLAFVPPQSLPLTVQRIQVTYTFPALSVVTSLNWSIVPDGCKVSTATVVQVLPPSVEWLTEISVWVSLELNWVTETYREFTRGLLELSSTCSHGLSVRPPENNGLTAAAGAFQVVPPSVDFSKTTS